MNVWEWIIGQAADAFTPSGKTALDGALQQIFKQPLPPINSPLFKQLFAVTWALGIVLGIVTGFFSATFYMGRSLTSIGDGLGFAARLTFFIRVFAFGFIAPPGTVLALYVGHGVTGLALELPGMNKNAASISELSVIAAISDVITGAIVSTLSYLVSLGLQAQASSLSILILLVLCLSPVFYGLSIVGDGGLAVWRFWVALWLMPIVAIPVMAWVLAIGKLITGWVRGLGGLWAAPASWGALLFMLLACCVPLILFVLFQSKVKDKIQPAFVPAGSDPSFSGAAGGSVPAARPSGIKHALAATATAAIGARIAMATDTETEPTEATPRRGTLRMKTGEALGTAGAALRMAHPVAGVAVTAVGAGVAGSGRKALDKASSAQTAPPAAPQPAPPAPPPAAPGTPPGASSVPSPQPRPQQPPPIVHQASESSAPPQPPVFLPVRRRDQPKS